MQMFFDGHYPSLPSYWIFYGAEPRHIPKYSAVYIVVGADKVVKYVGQTTNMQQRYIDHGKWMKRNDKIGWIKCETEELLFLEAWFIATLRPYLNSNQNKRARQAIATRSASLDVHAVHVWKRGQLAEINETTRCFEKKTTGWIEEIDQTSVRISGKWFHRQKVKVLLK